MRTMAAFLMATAMAGSALAQGAPESPKATKSGHHERKAKGTKHAGAKEAAPKATPAK